MTSRHTFLMSALTLLLPVTATLAGPGDLDVTFGTEGKVISQIGSTVNYRLSCSAVRQNDGKIVVAGTVSNGTDDDFVTLRYLPDGTLDTSFGTAGKTITPIGTSHDISRKVALQADGKIIVIGQSDALGGYRLAMVRYLTNGSLDSSFGVNGKVTGAAGSRLGFVLGLVIQADGKIVVAGSTGGKFTTERYNAGGSLDTNFGMGGVVMTSISTGYSNDTVEDLALQPDGKLVAAGRADQDYAVVRYLPDGSLDTSFNGTGKVVTSVGSGYDFCGAVTVQGDGKILLAGSSAMGSQYDFSLVRYSAAGSLDATFGTAGKAVISFGSEDDGPHAVSVLSSGKILVFGASEQSWGDFGFIQPDFAIARLNANGSLDTSFGIAGKVTTPVRLGLSDDFGYALMIQPDGGIVAAGTTLDGVALVRYEGDPLPPPLPPPGLTAPGTKTAPGSIVTTLTPTLTWKAVSKATGYSLRVTHVSSGQVVVTEDSLGAVTSYVLPPDILLPSAAYSWTVSTRNAGGTGPASAPFYFTVAESVPVPARLTALSPGTATQPGAVISTLTPTFLWKPLAGTLGHALHIMDMGTGGVAFSSDALGTAGAFILPAGSLQPGKAYSWTIRARNAVGWGSSSPLFYFQTKSDVVTLPPPSLAAPGAASAPGSVIANLSPAFTWKAVTGATGYGLYIADVATNQLVYDRDDLPTATTLALPSGILQWGRAYRWNMRTKGSLGWGGFSPRFFFQTKSDFTKPGITTISPAVLLGSDAAQPVLIEGTGFRAGAQVLLSWTGKSDYLVPAAQTALESATRLRISIKTTKTADTWMAKVRNTDLKVSDPVSFQVIAPAASSLAAPSASPPAGAYTQPVRVSLSQSQSTSIRYTLDGLLPDAFSRLYSGTPLLLGAAPAVTLRAQAVNGTSPPSAELSARYTFNLPVLSLPGSKAALSGSEGSFFYYKLTVPAGLAQIVLTTSSGTGDCDLYAARGRLPTTTDYDWSSRQLGMAAESLTLASPVPGTYHVMLHGRAAYSGVTLATAQTKATGTTAVPTLSHAAGQHSAPISLTVACADSGAQIYYYPGTGDPISLGRRLLAGERIDIAQNTTVSVRSWLQGKAPSAVVTAAFTIQQAAKEILWEPVNAGNGISYKDSVFSVETAQATKDKPVEQEFYFDVPADPAPGTAASELRFPVAVTFTKNSYAGTSEIFLNRGNTASAAKYLVKVENLPAKDDMEMREFRATHVLGTVVGGKGVFLIPGARYYGMVRAGGSPDVDATSGSHASAVAKLRITLELHECRLLKAPSDSSNVLAGQAKTWVIIHGRDSKAENNDFRTMADALHLHGPAEQIGQVLRLDWSSMSKPRGDWLASSGDSLDEAIYTPGIGKRLSSLLSQWQMPNATTSVIGHSWGSYAAFEYGKSGKAARIVALDPATLGTGDYEETKVNFSSSATRSWAFFTDGGLFGSSLLTGTAHEGFVLRPTPSAPSSAVYLSAAYREWSLKAHTAPVQFFTHLLRSNYEPGYPTAQTEVTDYFRLSRLDLQTDPAYWKSRAFWRRNLFGSRYSAYPFEAELDVTLDDHGFDEATPLTLRYFDLISGNETTRPTPP